MVNISTQVSSSTLLEHVELNSLNIYQVEGNSPILFNRDYSLNITWIILPIWLLGSKINKKLAGCIAPSMEKGEYYTSLVLNDLLDP